MTFDNVKALQDWANEHEPAESLYFHKSWWFQIMDVRDRIPQALGMADHRQVEVGVCSQHTAAPVAWHVVASKSTLLPVYMVKYKGMTIRMRANYYDWVISVEDYEVATDEVFQFVSQLSPEDINPLFAEGFKPEWVFPHLDRGSLKYTISLPNFHWVFTFFYLLGKDCR